MNKKGFTLVEIMIVVLIIGLLAAIAIPNFIKARKTSQMNACIDNMRVIEGAIELALMQGETITDVEALCGTGADAFIRGNEPKCPAVKDSEPYPITENEDGSYTVKCPNKVKGHVLSGAPE